MSTPTPLSGSVSAPAAGAVADEDKAEKGDRSKSAQKRLAKQQAKDAEKAAKAASKPAPAAGAPSDKKRSLVAGEDEEDVDPTQYFDQRVRELSEMRAAGKHRNLYPHKFHAALSLPQFQFEYRQLDIGHGQRLEREVSVAGRVYNKRSSGASLYFYDLQGQGERVQIVADRKSDKDDFSIHEHIKRGDIIGVVGQPGRSNTGELSIFPSSTVLLTPCLRLLPSKHHGLKDQETRYRQRYLDLMLNPKNRQHFYTRSKIINHVRRFLDERGFLEVETPMMNMIPGGAAARPFRTHHNDLNLDMFMRIAPELYLKQLVIGGLDRVYEMGRQFRNEGIDMTHNPEFTTVEFYWAYYDYEDLIRVTEEMLSGMVFSILGTYKVRYQPDDSYPAREIDFTPPFRRINMMEGLEAATKTSFPTDLTTADTNQFLSSLVDQYNINCPAPRTTARLLDKLVGHFLEDGIVNPTFICEHPEIMSPLAKTHRTKHGLTERFELFVCEKELCNAYTELNNPLVQRERFAAQSKDKAAGDDEAQQLDEESDSTAPHRARQPVLPPLIASLPPLIRSLSLSHCSFCVALDYGLPPTAGWGMGIDRLTMFLSNVDNIKEVLLFPAMKPIEGGPKVSETNAAVKSDQAAAGTEDKHTH